MACKSYMAGGVAIKTSMAFNVTRNSPRRGLLWCMAGVSFWKVHHLNERRKTDEFYARLEEGEITVNATLFSYPDTISTTPNDL